MFKFTKIPPLLDDDLFPGEFEYVRIEEWREDHWMNCGVVTMNTGASELLTLFLELGKRALEK